MDLVQGGTWHGHQMVVHGQIIGPPDIKAMALQQLVDITDTAGGGILQRQDCDIGFISSHQQAGFGKRLDTAHRPAGEQDRTGLAGVGCCRALVNDPGNGRLDGISCSDLFTQTKIAVVRQQQVILDTAGQAHQAAEQFFGPDAIGTFDRVTCAGCDLVFPQRIKNGRAGDRLGPGHISGQLHAFGKQSQQLAIERIDPLAQLAEVGQPGWCLGGIGRVVHSSILPFSRMAASSFVPTM